MAFTHGDWTIDRTTKELEYTGADHSGAATYGTVIEFHRWLQSLADDQIAVVANSDELDITNTDPSRRSTDNIITLINGYTLKEDGTRNAVEFLFDGTIIQDEGDTIFDGIVNFGNADVVIQIIQDGAIISDDWWNLTGPVGVNPDSGQGISHRFMVPVRRDGVDIDGRRLIGTTRVMDTGAAPGTDHYTFSEFKINGTSRGNNVLALTNANDLNNTTDETTIAAWTVAINEGLQLIDIDADTVDEEYFCKIDSVSDYDQNQYYEYTKWMTRDASSEEMFGISGEVFRGITHSLAWGTETGSAVGTISSTAAQFYVWGTTLIYNNGGVNDPFVVGEALHETTATPVWKARVLAVDDNGTTGTLIVAVEGTAEITTADSFTTVRGASEQTADANGTPTVVTGGGVIVALALDDDTGTGNLYGQVIKGTVSADTDLLYFMNDDLTALNVANYLTQSGAATERTIALPWVGTSTGTNIIGAYGVGFETDQVDDGDTLTALDGDPYSRPNLVTNAVGGLSQDGDDDRVLVAEWDTDSGDVGQGAGYDINGDPVINKQQMAINVLLDADDETQITIGHANGDNLTVPIDTPAAGSLRVIDDAGYERFIPYSSWTGLVFTINTGHPDIGNNNDFLSNEAAVGNLCYVTYIDDNAATATLSWESTYKGSQTDLVALVRNGDSTAPIKQFIAEWSITAADQTLNAIRTTDL